MVRFLCKNIYFFMKNMMCGMSFSCEMNIPCSELIFFQLISEKIQPFYSKWKSKYQSNHVEYCFDTQKRFWSKRQRRSICMCLCLPLGHVCLKVLFCRFLILHRFGCCCKIICSCYVIFAALNSININCTCQFLFWVLQMCQKFPLLFVVLQHHIQDKINC